MAAHQLADGLPPFRAQGHRLAQPRHAKFGKVHTFFGRLPADIVHGQAENRRSLREIVAGEIEQRGKSMARQDGRGDAAGAGETVIDGDRDRVGRQRSGPQPRDCIAERQDRVAMPLQVFHSPGEGAAVHEQRGAKRRLVLQGEAVIAKDAQPPARQPAREREQARKFGQAIYGDGGEAAHAGCLLPRPGQGVNGVWAGPRWHSSQCERYRRPCAASRRIPVAIMRQRAYQPPIPTLS